jgi:hypothetical protein
LEVQLLSSAQVTKASLMRNRISLREKTLTKKNARTALKLVVLTVLFIVTLIFYGIPLFARFASFLIDLRTTPGSVEIDNQAPPPPPILDDLPSATNSSKIDITGSSQPGATVILNLNNDTKEVLVDREGRFSHQYSLKAGDNIIQATTKSTSGLESARSKTIRILFDDEPPLLEISRPEDGAEFYGSRQRQMTLEGVTDEDATLLINQRSVIVNSTGQFTFYSTLNDGENTFVVIAQDRAGNSSEMEITVTYHP